MRTIVVAVLLFVELLPLSIYSQTNPPDREWHVLGDTAQEEPWTELVATFEKLLRQKDWNGALTLCTKRVQDAAKTFSSNEAFFKTCVPLDWVTFECNTHTTNLGGGQYSVTSLHTNEANMVMNNHNADYVIPHGDTSFQVTWRARTTKEDATYKIDFDTRPLATQLDAIALRFRQDTSPKQ